MQKVIKLTYIYTRASLLKEPQGQANAKGSGETITIPTEPF